MEKSAQQLANELRQINNKVQSPAELARNLMQTYTKVDATQTLYSTLTSKSSK